MLVGGPRYGRLKYFDREREREYNNAFVVTGYYFISLLLPGAPVSKKSENSHLWAVDYEVFLEEAASGWDGRPKLETEGCILIIILLIAA